MTFVMTLWNLLEMAVSWYDLDLMAPDCRPAHPPRQDGSDTFFLL
jgi:hypothetical protein